MDRISSGPWLGYAVSGQAERLSGIERDSIALIQSVGGDGTPQGSKYAKRSHMQGRP